MAIVTAAPNSGDSEGTIGTVAWTNPGNVTASDDTYAEATLSDGDITEYLRCSNFGFSLPVDAVPSYLQFRVHWKASIDGPLYPELSANNIALYRAGTYDESDGWGSSPLPTTEEIVNGSYTFHNSWSASDLNDTGFGVGFSLRADGGTDPATAQIDYIEVDVVYNDNELGPSQVITRRLVMPRQRSTQHVCWDDDPPAPTPSDDIPPFVAAMRRQAGARGRFLARPQPTPQIYDIAAIKTIPDDPVVLLALRPLRGSMPRPSPQFVLVDCWSGYGECECWPGAAVLVGQGYGVVVVGLENELRPAAVTTYQAKPVGQGYGGAVVVNFCEC